MLRTPHLLDALRVAASWLLVVSVFVGPVGLGGSVFASANKTCGASCPCEATSHDDHADEHDAHHEHDARDAHEHDARADSSDGDPCEDACPDDCSNCGCCLGIAIAVLPLPMISRAVGGASARMPTPVDAPASGACSGVFRPPRSLT